MLRRSLVIAALGAWAPAAWAQTEPAAQTPPPAPRQAALIQPENALEYALVSALSNEGMRPIFRRYLLETHVVVALASADEDGPARVVRIREDFSAAALFTSATRIDAVFGADAPRIIINGRAALSRLRQSNVVINPGLRPMLTLEPADVAEYLATPGETSAGPTQ